MLKSKDMRVLFLGYALIIGGILIFLWAKKYTFGIAVGCVGGACVLFEYGFAWVFIFIALGLGVWCYIKNQKDENLIEQFVDDTVQSAKAVYNAINNLKKSDPESAAKLKELIKNEPVDDEKIRASVSEVLKA